MATGTDVDWYTFTTTSRQRVRVHTSGLDTRITLFDASVRPSSASMTMDARLPMRSPANCG